MSIFGTSPRRAMFNEQIKQLRGQITAQAENHRLELERVQHLIVDDILSIQKKDVSYKGNAYPTYAEALEEIILKYNGTADWGVLQTGAIIDLRAAFIIGEGISITRKKPKVKAAKGNGNGKEKEAGQAKQADDVGRNEEDFCQRFLDWNDLDREMAQEFAKEAEMEGKILMRLFWDEEAQMPNVRYIPYAEKKYEIITDPNDYLWYKQAKWKGSTGEKISWKEETVGENEFVYKKFGGRISDPNSASPRIMKCLTQVENLDKALRDLREINNLFAGPVPDIECENGDQVKEAQEKLARINFGKIRKLLAHVGKFAYKQPTMDGADSLIKEIEMLAKMISGTTGIPVHYLGLLDILRNRATGENLYDLLFGATSKERQIWRGVYQELLVKAMEMFNENATATKQMSQAKKLNPTLIQVDIPTITQENWDRIEKVFLPAALGGKISDELFLQQIPGIDIEEELARKEQARTDELTQVKEENKNLRADALDRNLSQGKEADNA